MSQTNALAEQMDGMYHGDMVPVTYTTDLESALMTRARDLRNAIIYGFTNDVDKQTAMIASLSEVDKQVDDLVAKLEASPLSQDERSRLDAFKASYPAFQALSDRVIKAASSGQADAAMAELENSGDIVAKPIGEIQALKQLSVDAAEKRHEEAEQTAAQASTTILIILAVAIVLGLGIALFIGRDIARMVGLILTVVDRVAVGDLNRDMDERTKNSIRNRSDEMGAIGRGLTEIIRYMRAWPTTPRL